MNNRKFMIISCSILKEFLTLDIYLQTLISMCLILWHFDTPYTSRKLCSIVLVYWILSFFSTGASFADMV